MSARKRNNAGFTLIELMVVVAIIAILAGIAVPLYMSYIQRSRLTSRVFPGLHAIQLNLATYYTAQGEFPTDPSAIDIMISEADTTYFNVAINVNEISITLTPNQENADDNPFRSLIASGRHQLIATASTQQGKITQWELSGELAKALGIADE